MVPSAYEHRSLEQVLRSLDSRPRADLRDVRLYLLHPGLVSIHVLPCLDRRDRVFDGDGLRDDLWEAINKAIQGVPGARGFRYGSDEADETLHQPVIARLCVPERLLSFLRSLRLLSVILHYYLL